MKRFLAMLLAIVMLISLFPTAVFAEGTDTAVLEQENIVESGEADQTGSGAGDEGNIVQEETIQLPPEGDENDVGNVPGDAGDGTDGTGEDVVEEETAEIKMTLVDTPKVGAEVVVVRCDNFDPQAVSFTLSINGGEEKQLVEDEDYNITGEGDNELSLFFDGLAAGSYVLKAYAGEVVVAELSFDVAEKAPVKVQKKLGATQNQNHVAAVCRSETDSIYYETLAAAVEAAQSGETVTLLTNISISEQINIEKAITLDGGNFTITRESGGDTAFKKAGLLVTAGATIKDLTVSGPNGNPSGWDEGEFGIKLYQANNATLTDVKVTGANAGIQVNGGSVKMTGTIDVSGNEFGGIELCHNGTLNLTAATLKCDDETDAKPVLWNDDTKGDITQNPNQPLWKKEIDGKDKDHYYLNAVAMVVGSGKSTVYSTLAEAIAAVPDNAEDATTITMVANEAIDVAGKAGVTIPATKKVVLDLNGFEIAGVCSTGEGSALLENKGTLTVMDGSETGAGKMTYGATPAWIYDGETYAGSYASNVITNLGTLTVNSGTIENKSNGSACYAVDNQTNGGSYDVSCTVNSGKLIAEKTAFRSFLNSTTKENTVVINGGEINANAGYGIMFQDASANKNLGSLTINSGTIKSNRNDNYRFALYAYATSTYDATGITVNVNGGTYDGYIALGSGLKQNTSIQGDVKATGIVNYAGSKIVTSGYYKVDEYVDGSDDCKLSDYVAPGYECVEINEDSLIYNYKVQPKMIIPIEGGGSIGVDVEAKTEQKAEPAPGADEKAQDYAKKLSDSSSGKIVDLSNDAKEIVESFDNLDVLKTFVEEKGEIDKLESVLNTAATAAAQSKNVSVKTDVNADTKVVVKSVKSETVETVTKTTFALDITPVVTVKVTTTVGNEEPTTVIVVEKPLEITDARTVSIPAPEDFEYEDGMQLYIKHILHDKTVRTYNASYDRASKIIVFENPDGFSEFELIVEQKPEGKVAAVIHAGGTFDYYDTLQAAFDVAQDGDTVFMLEDVTITEQLEINKAITLDGGNKTITRTPGGADKAYKAGILVSNAAATVQDLTVSGPNGNPSGWDEGEFGIKLFNATGATLNNVSVKKANAGIQVNGGSVKMTGTINVSENEFGGIELCHGAVLDLSEATLVCTDEAEARPVLWNDDTKGTITQNTNQPLWKKEIEGKDKDHYYLSVAKIGDVYYKTLAEAIVDVGENETVTLIANTTSQGISVPSGKNFTLDLNGETLTFEKPGAGSNGTKTQGFQLLKDSNITIKNGKIDIAESNKDTTWTSDATEKGIAMLIQNYANLTLEGVELDGSNIAHNGNNVRYVLSNNSGTVVIGDTKITAATGDFAFDTCKYRDYAVPTVEVKGTSEITGNVELSGGNLALDSGKLNGELKVAGKTLSGVITKNENFQAEAPVGYKWANGRLVPIDTYVAKNVNTDKTYATLEEALDEAESGQTVELLKNIGGEDGAPAEKYVVVETGVTLNLAGYNISGATMLYVTGKVKDTMTSAETKGTVSAAGYVIPAGAAEDTDFYLPVYTEGGYKFFKLDVLSMWNPDDTNEFDFTINVESERSEACKLLKTTIGASRVKAAVTVTWNNSTSRGEQTFTFADSFMMKYAESPSTLMFYAVFSGLEALSDVEVQARFIAYNEAGSPIASINGSSIPYNYSN